MIAIFVTKITNRIKYTFDFVFSQLIITDYKLYDDFEEFIVDKNYKMVYNKQKANDLPLVYSKTILFKHDICEIDINSDVVDNVPVIYTHDNKDSILPFDPFAAIFYLISRYEEYLLHMCDEHKRYKHTNSIAYKNGFLDVPIIHIWAKMLEDKLQSLFPNLIVKHRKYEFRPTIDVDQAYCFINKGFTRVVGGLVKSILTADFQRFTDRLSVIFRIKHDPFDSFDFLIDLQKQHNLNFKYFFLLASDGDNNNSCSIENYNFCNLIRHVRDYADVGIHPSYASSVNTQLIELEKQSLENIIHCPVTMSRQHFLRFEISSTFRALLENNITEDYSMGYPEITGFRAGTCIPFPFYDLENDEPTNLLIHPVSVMDCTLFNYMKLDSTAAIDEIKRIIKLTKNFNGVFIPLWHNSSLSNMDEWKNKTHIFNEMISEGLEDR